jgi:hypothetical protein
MGPASISASISIPIICTAAFHTPLAALTLNPLPSIPYNRNAIPLKRDISSSQTSQDPIPAPTWEMGHSANSEPGLTWQTTVHLPTNSTLAWQLAEATEQLTAHPTPAQPDDQQGDQQKQRKLSLFGLGAGARTLFQDETLPVIQGTIRVIQTGNDVLNSVSIRPTVFLPYNSACLSSKGPGCEFEYRLAGTLDFFQTNYISGFIGAGAAINKDSLDKNAAMATIGIEANLSKYITLGGTLNLIDSDDNRELYGGLSWADVELLLTINFRF